MWEVEGEEVSHLRQRGPSESWQFSWIFRLGVLAKKVNKREEGGLELQTMPAEI